MEIFEVNTKEFENTIPKPHYVYGQSAFAELNIDKADKIYYLLFKDRTYRLGLSVGVRNNSLYSPFSAPFGGFVYLNKSVKIGYINDALKILQAWAIEKKITFINITLPPPIYQKSFVSKQENALFRNGYVIKNIDLNYSFNLKDFNDNYINNIWRNARKNLKKSFNNHLVFKKCNYDTEKENAYNIISINRNTRGFPLRMSWEQIKKTTQLIPSDFFILSNSLNEDIAASIVFHVSSNIVQVIYWGDIPKFSELKTMNFLTYKIFEYYKNQNYLIVDIGPSTVDSMPNYGLCEFKEGIGCGVEHKLTFQKRI